MRTKLIAAILLLLCSQMGQALACAVCYGGEGAKSTQHMAAAIWVLMGFVMSIVGGVGMFSFHLWRHARAPLEPHQQLTDEDLDKYE